MQILLSTRNNRYWETKICCLLEHVSIYINAIFAISRRITSMLKKIEKNRLLFQSNWYRILSTFPPISTKSTTPYGIRNPGPYMHENVTGLNRIIWSQHSSSWQRNLNSNKPKYVRFRYKNTNQILSLKHHLYPLHEFYS